MVAQQTAFVAHQRNSRHEQLSIPLYRFRTLRFFYASGTAYAHRGWRFYFCPTGSIGGMRRFCTIQRQNRRGRYYQWQSATSCRPSDQPDQRRPYSGVTAATPTQFAYALGLRWAVHRISLRDQRHLRSGCALARAWRSPLIHRLLLPSRPSERCPGRRSAKPRFHRCGYWHYAYLPMAGKHNGGGAWTNIANYSGVYSGAT